MIKATSLAITGALVTSLLFGKNAAAQDKTLTAEPTAPPTPSGQMLAQTQAIQAALYAARPDAAPMAYKIAAQALPLKEMEWNIDEKKTLDIDSLMTAAKDQKRDALHFRDHGQDYQIHMTALAQVYQGYKATARAGASTTLPLSGKLVASDEFMLTNSRRIDDQRHVRQSTLFLSTETMENMSSPNIAAQALHEGEHNQLPVPPALPANWMAIDYEGYAQQQIDAHLSNELCADRGILKLSTPVAFEQSMLSLAGYLNRQVENATDPAEKIRLAEIRDTEFDFGNRGDFDETHPAMGRRLLYGQILAKFKNNGTGMNIQPPPVMHLQWKPDEKLKP